MDEPPVNAVHDQAQESVNVSMAGKVLDVLLHFLMKKNLKYTFNSTWSPKNTWSEWKFIMLTLIQHLSTSRTTEIENLSSYFKPRKPVLGDFVISDKEKSDTFEMLLYNCTVGTCIELVRLTIEIGVNMITKSKQANCCQVAYKYPSA